MELISKQQAIDATWKDTGYTDPFNVMTAIRDRIKQLPPIQPANCSEFPNNSDTISRQAAIDGKICIQRANGVEIYDDYAVPVEYLKQLPPIQSKLLQPWEVLAAQAVLSQPAEPKRGKWILDRSGAYCCSECMEPCATYFMMKPRDKYCKMCGSRNEVTQ